VTLRYAVSIHDVAPATWAHCEALLALLPRGCPATLLVVPHYLGGTAVEEDAAVVAALRERVCRGDEVVLHGYYHLDDAPAPRNLIAWFRRRIYTAAEGEFEAIDVDTARIRIAQGLASLRRAGLAPRGFIAPAWLLGNAARTALAEFGLGYTCSRDALEPLPQGTPVPAPSLVWSSRSAWRRAASRLWNRRRLRVAAHAPLLRVALHPADACHPAVMQVWREVLAELAHKRQPVLESACLGLESPS
jgi:predicted deacetylase